MSRHFGIPSMTFIAGLAVLAPLCAAQDKAVLEAEADRIAVMNKAKDCVLAIFPANGQGGGSGVVISPDGYAVTNFHVALPCGKALQCGMADGEVYDAVLVGLDPTGDVALIKLFGRDPFPFAELADSDEVRVGDWVFAMGNPFLLAADFQPTVSYGIVSGVHRYQFPAGTLLEYADCLQTDAAINPGNSGGPLFDARGRLIGINGRGSFEKRGRVSVGVGYAISINQVKNFLGVLKSGRIVDHATVGAQVTSDAEGGAVVGNILETCDAFRRGLRYDDEIVSFGGRPVSTPNGFKNALGIFPKGWRVPLSYRREGVRHDVLVRLAGVHGEEELLKKALGRVATEPMPIPKPGKAPSPSKPEKAKPLPEKPRELPAAPRSNEAPMPEVVQKHFAEKRGFANYHFNAMHQQRVWNAWNSRADLAAVRGAWLLSGPLEGGGTFQFRIAEGTVSLKLPSTEIRWSEGENLTSSLLPIHSGGLLPALFLWRRLATEGLAKFGTVYYYGTAPLGDREGLADVLVGSYKGAECWFYFDPGTGDVLAMELFADEESDPCEIYFSEFQPKGSRFVPRRMEIRYGNERFATFRLEEFAIEQSEGVVP